MEAKDREEEVREDGGQVKAAVEVDDEVRLGESNQDLGRTASWRQLI
jgi:hypothetical protein